MVALGVRLTVVAAMLLALAIASTNPTIRDGLTDLAVLAGQAWHLASAGLHELGNLWHEAQEASR